MQTHTHFGKVKRLQKVVVMARCQEKIIENIFGVFYVLFNS